MSVADKLTIIAENEQKVYEAGKKSEYDAFWDVYQENGNREQYYMAFASANSKNWDATNFRPKYNLRPVNANYMFYCFGNTANLKFDMAAHLESIGITLDMSRCTNVQAMLNPWGIVRMPFLDLSSVTNTANMISDGILHTIDGIKFAETTDFSNAFKCTALKNITTVSGTIGRNINFASCPLTPASMLNIINCLKDYSGTSNANVYTVTFSNACWTALGTEYKAQVTAKGWNV